MYWTLQSVTITPGKNGGLYYNSPYLDFLDNDDKDPPTLTVSMLNALRQCIADKHEVDNSSVMIVCVYFAKNDL